MSDFSEAPVSFNVKATSADGFDVMLTLRDTHPTELMPRALKALEWLKAAGFHPNGHAVAKVDTSNLAPSPSAAPVANGAPVPIDRTNGTNALTGAESTNGETFGAAIINTLVIGQSTKGKLQLQFSGADTPTYRMTLPIDAMVQMLPTGWTAQHLQVGKAYDVTFRIHWREAGQYKNLFQIDQL
jgi:hypothetical protein